MLDKLKNKEALTNILLIFLIIQPALDFYILFTDSVRSAAGFSPTTIIRVAFILIMGLMIILIMKKDKKFYVLLFYIFIVLAYSILHCYNNIHVSGILPETYKFSIIAETFYIIRMLIPIAMIYIVCYSNINVERFNKIIVAVVLLFSGTIVISNLLDLSLSSYSEFAMIKGNFFSWFTRANTGYGVIELSSKGFFFSANQISALLIMLLPISLYFTITKFNKLNIITVLVQILSMIMLSTRVATYGWIIIVAAVTIMYLFFTLIKKEFAFKKRKLVFLILVLVMFCGIISIAPITTRKYVKDFVAAEDTSKTDEIKEEVETLPMEEDVIGILSEGYTDYSIPADYIKKIYPLENDVDFWMDFINKPAEQRIGNRAIEGLITSRIKQLRANPMDRFVGMGYSRMTNAGLYIEEDFYAQYYTMGAIGVVLFLFFYIVIIIYSFIRAIKNYKNRFNFLNIILMLSVGTMLIVSVYSGHVLDELVVTIYAGTLCGMLIKLIYEEK